MFRVELAPAVVRELTRVKKRDTALYHRFVLVIDSLGEDPYQGKKLRGDLSGRWSLRVGSYRIIYRVFKERLLIWVIDLGHRREIYR